VEIVTCYSVEEDTRVGECETPLQQRVMLVENNARRITADYSRTEDLLKSKLKLD
jgi:uncharacterized protein YheU (UPF0270 family)